MAQSLLGKPAPFDFLIQQQIHILWGTTFSKLCILLLVVTLGLLSV